MLFYFIVIHVTGNTDTRQIKLLKEYTGSFWALQDTEIGDRRLCEIAQMKGNASVHSLDSKP